MRRALAVALLMVGVTAVPAWAGGGGGGGAHCEEVQAPETTSRVIMKQSCYAPQQILVKPGATVTFVNYDEAEHTVTSTQGGWAGKFHQSGGWVQIRFPEAGSYPYYCVFHPNMTGSVVVGDSTAKPDYDSPFVVDHGVDAIVASHTESALDEVNIAAPKPAPASASGSTPLAASLLMASLIPAVAIASYTMGRRRGRASA